jgi:electron transport complex protein RnfE
MLKQLLLLIVQMLKIINRKEQTMNNFKVLMNGIVKENPTFVLLLGMCPTLGTTSSAINGMGMGLATMFASFILNFSRFDLTN